MPEQYVIRGGQAGYDRLLLLAQKSGRDTSALLKRAGVRTGMRGIDVGCGGGTVTIELAQMTAPDGLITGIDMDAVKLDLAREEASRRRIDNVEFRTADVNAWDEPATYDLVYSRFLLQHLTARTELVARMWDAVRPGGVLIVEDADFDGWACHPPNAGFDFFVRTYCEALRRRGGDPTAGRQLFEYFVRCGIPTPEMRVVETVDHAGDTKAMAWSTLDATQEAIVAAGVASAEDVGAALADLRGFTDDATTLISGPRVYQLWVERPLAATRRRG
jgi:ubiquinone/menaquinone biosynthesis C-methylase UbiE